MYSQHVKCFNRKPGSKRRSWCIAEGRERLWESSDTVQSDVTRGLAPQQQITTDSVSACLCGNRVWAQVPASVLDTSSSSHFSARAERLRLSHASWRLQRGGPGPGGQHLWWTRWLPPPPTWRGLYPQDAWTLRSLECKLGKGGGMTLNLSTTLGSNKQNKLINSLIW